MTGKRRKKFQNRKNPHPNLNFSQKIIQKYKWKSDRNRIPNVSMIHRKSEKRMGITGPVNERVIERIIERYVPKPVTTPGYMIERQERNRLISVIEEVGHQDGERKKLEQLIFRRKEEEWRKIIQVQEDQVRSLQREIIKQKKEIEIVEKRMEEPAIDTNRLFLEFRKKLEQQLRLEQLRTGL